MSPRAASRLESLGFKQVYDYVAGKADWGSAGLQLEGDDPSDHRAGTLARSDVPTCLLEEHLSAVRQRVEQAGWDTCFVVDEHTVVLGRLGRTAMRRADDVTAEAAMTAGSSTIRPSARLDPMVKRMRDQNLSTLPVTTSDGRLVGLLFREDAERAVAEEQ